MTRKGTYYLGRVVKLGRITNESLVKAILNPKPVTRRKSAWTFVDVQDFGSFVYGRLAKYAPESDLVKVDPGKGQEIIQQEENISIASSPFVYIVEHSGIAFLHVSNHIEKPVFASRFCDIVKKGHDNFFADCKIELITDLRTFSLKLSRLEGIYRITARVFPPNPLFGPLWKSLKNYLEERSTDKLKIQEESLSEEPLRTALPKHVKMVAENPEELGEVKGEIPFGDAAILMAADGYGSGLIEGKQGDEMVLIRTSETTRNFRYYRRPQPEELYKIALEIFEKVRKERHMEEL
jgi:hypothetical protein